MIRLDRITHDPQVMGGKLRIRGMRVTAEEILADYPYLEAEDIRAALSYAAWRCMGIEGA